jgi:hypothetical protein
MATVVSQPTYRPTNKLTAAMLAGAAYEFLEPAVAIGVSMAGEALGIPWTLGPGLSTLIQFGLMFGFGYVVRDRPNVVPEPRYDGAV